jgi:hypothetical protein
VEQAKQLHRDERTFQGLGQIQQDIRYTLRQLRRSPGFTVTAILMLALGIGATTAIFSIVEGVLLRPLPFPDPDRLVILGDVLEGLHCASCTQSSVTAPDIRNYMRDTESFSHLGGYRQRLFELSGTGEPAAVNATRMSGEVFAALGVSPVLGRTFTQQEDEEGQQVAVLSYSMWRSRFHGDANVLGSKILLYRKPYTVIGVMPRDFEFPLNPGNVNQSELWLPLSLQPENLRRAARVVELRMVGRLKPSITAEQAQSDAEQWPRRRCATIRPSCAVFVFTRWRCHCMKIRWRRRDPWCAPCSLHDRCSADRLANLAGLLLCVPSADEGDRGAARTGCSRGTLPDRPSWRHGLEYRRWRDRAGTGGCRSAGGRKPAAGDLPRAMRLV